MKFPKVFSNLRNKYNVSVRNPHDDREVWHIFISPFNLLTGLLAFIIVLFVIVVTAVTFTPVMDLVPGYQGNKARAILIESSMKLDSLERELNTWNDYYNNIVRIMDGRKPLAVGGSTDTTTYARITDVQRIPEDSILRAQMEGDGPYALQSSAQYSQSLNYTEIFPPIKGVVSNKFNPAGGMLGVDIITADNMAVSAVMDGTVILSSWTPDEGAVIYIQHTNSMISAYLNNSRILKKVGDRVTAGEVIAFTGSSLTEGADRGFVRFQLWNNGLPVDPENYIVF